MVVYIFIYLFSVTIIYYKTIGQICMLFFEMIMIFWRMIVLKLMVIAPFRFV